MNEDDAHFKLAEYLWNYFELHANQRITLFKFYTGFCILIVSSIGYLLLRFHENNHPKELFALFLVLSIFIIVITRIFDYLDKRNRQLIHNAEESLRHLEGNIQHNIKVSDTTKIEKIQIFMIENNDKVSGKSLTGHTQCFNYLFLCFYIFGISLFIISFCKLGIIESLWQLIK